MRRIVFVFAVVVAVVGSSVAFADPVPNEPAKDPATAVLLSAGTTLVGMGLVTGENDKVALLGVITMYVGPATGSWYAGSAGVPGLVARLVAAGLIVKGLQKWQNEEDGWDCPELTEGECDASFAWAEREGRRGTYLVWSGVGLWATSTVVDIVLAHRAAKKSNERQLAVAPTYVNGSPGVALGMRF